MGHYCLQYCAKPAILQQQEAACMARCWLTLLCEEKHTRLKTLSSFWCKLCFLFPTFHRPDFAVCSCTRNPPSRQQQQYSCSNNTTSRIGSEGTTAAAQPGSLGAQAGKSWGQTKPAAAAVIRNQPSALQTGFVWSSGVTGAYTRGEGQQEGERL
ncbi:hypothetical protein Bbelb_437030 [Branchiostoma belcheri]|nr:hypothetical protein Bbelb_437030 [Branchiostoma belcheri]